MMEVVDAVKQAVPNAANRPAGEVLEFVLGKLTGNSVVEIEAVGNQGPIDITE